MPTQPLIQAALDGNGPLCTSMGLAWVAYIGASTCQATASHAAVVELAVQVGRQFGRLGQLGCCLAAAQSGAMRRALRAP